jgi:predicted dehydrogenase
MGQAHSRSLRRLDSIFEGLGFLPRLVVCADSVPARRERALSGFGFEEATESWLGVVEHPDVEAVWVTAPNAVHLEMVRGAASAGKHVFCEKPVGGTPEQTVAAWRAARDAGVLSGVGYNYRWAPMVLEARRLVAGGALGRITNYRGRFFSSYGSDPLGVLSWRFRREEGGYGVSSDLLSHAVDLAQFLLGPIAAVSGHTATVIPERPVPPAEASHYSRGSAGDPLGQVTNEDYASMLCRFDDGAAGVFETSRTMIGPESQMAFEVYGTAGALGWNLERMNELQLYLASDGRLAGYRTIFAGERFDYHGSFVPGNANAIGFEDLVTIEDLEFCRCVHENRPFHPGFDDAVGYVQVQDALLASVESGCWERVERDEQRGE